MFSWMETGVGGVGVRVGVGVVVGGGWGDGVSGVIAGIRFVYLAVKKQLVLAYVLTSIVPWNKKELCFVFMLNFGINIKVNTVIRTLFHPGEVLRSIGRLCYSNISLW